MDAGDDLLDGLFSSVRRALVEESRRRPQYPGNRCRAPAAGSSATTTGDLVRRSNLSSATATTEIVGGADVKRADTGDACPTVVAGDCGDSPAAVGYRRRLCEAEHGTVPAVLAARAGGSEARDNHEKMLHRGIKNNAEETLRSLRKRRRHAGAARRARVGHMTSRCEAFCHLTACRLAQARAQGLVMARRLQLQCADSTRRLQELLHECVGEYEKARLRGLRRRRLSAEACDSVLSGKILDLRWSRFCSRLEEDALGLVSARDMGNPTAEGGHGRNAGSSSSSSAAATATVAALLAPLLARSGLGESRILRIVAVSPRSAGGELERSAISSGTTAATGFGRLPHSEQRRGSGRGVRGGGIVEALREELRDEGAVVLDAGAENSPLGVADVFRKAVLCGNGGLVAALSCSDGAAHGHQRHCNGKISNGHGIVRAAVVGGRSSSVLPVVGLQGKPGDKELSIAPRSSVPRRGHRNDSAGGSSGSETAEGAFGSRTGCVVVGAEPGLLLSSSHLLWALRPPFGEATGTAYKTTFDGTGEGADRVRGRGSNEEPDRDGGDRAREDPAQASGRWNRDSESGVRARESTSGNGSRRESLDRDVAWIRAAPVGSRVYYCLEEAEWEASRRRDGYASSLPHAASTLGFEDSVPRGSDRRRRRPRSAEDAPRSALRHDRRGQKSPGSGDDGDDASSEEAEIRARHFRSERELHQDDGKKVDTAHDRTKAAATAFARSMSRMLAKVYLDPKPHHCTNPKSEGRKDGEDGSGDNGFGTPAPAAWASRTGGEASAGSGFASEDATAAATFVVSNVTDAHRRIARSKADFDGDERLEALAAVPDVLVAADRPVELRGKHRGHNFKAAPTDPPSLHFAPAGVVQLVGTPHFREFVEALPPAARARLSKLYPESSIRAAPIGQLYVALAPAVARGRELSAPPPVASATPTEGASRKVVEQQQRAGMQPEQGDGLPSCRPRQGGGICPIETAGAEPPMCGALVHPLPARAVRELLQIYVATTRAVGVVRTAAGQAGLGKARHHRTSGLFVPPPLLTARDRSRCIVDSQPAKNDDGTKAADRDCAEPRRGGKAGRFGERGRSPEEGVGQLEELVGGWDDGDSKGSCDGDGREIDWVYVAARAPSAVDVLPDTPIQTGDAGSGSLLSARIEPRKRQPYGSQNGVSDKNEGGFARRATKAVIQGFGARDQRRNAAETVGHDDETSTTPAVLTRGNSAMTTVPIASSLRTPFHHKYAAVLSPPPPPPVPSTGANGNSDIGGQSAGQRADAGGKPKNSLSGASALILQLKTKTPCATGKDAPRLSVADIGGARGSGGVGDKAMVDSIGGAGASQCVIPPRVCGWRACLAESSSGSLCAAHLELKDFLDAKAAKNGGVSDAFRFLPPGSGPKRRSSPRKRRAAAAAAAATTADASSTAAKQSAISATLSTEGVGASNGEGELSVARSMSPLLSELLNGKLGKTIAMFCRRAAEESRASRRRGPRQQAPPEWARWADPDEVKAADSRLDADARWAEKVLRAEKEVTLELRRLSNLKIYPVAELAHIRREHDAMAKEWRQAVGGGGVEDGDAQYGEEEDEAGSNSKDAPARFSAQPLLMMLPPSGTKRRQKEPLIPPLAGYGATTTSSQSPAALGTPGAALAEGEVQLSPLSTLSGPGASGGHGGPAAERRAGGRRQRRKGSVSATYVGAGLAGVRNPAEGRGVRGGRTGGGRQVLPASQGRSEQEIELEFSRLKWALFRRRRQEAEIPRAVARGHAPGHGQALVPPLNATPPIFSPAGGGASRHRGTREVGASASAGGSPADTPIKLPVSSPATPTEQQLYQLARTTGKHGGGGGGRRRHQQQQQQQSLVDIKKMQPLHQAVYSDRRELPPQPSESGLRPSSSTLTGTAFPHQRQELLSPTGSGDQHRISHQPQQATARFPPKAGEPPAATIPTATSNLRRRDTSPPKWESRAEITQPVGSCSSDDEAAAGTGAAGGEGPAQAMLPLPRGTAERAMRDGVLSSDGSERGKKTEERRKGGPSRIILRRRASVAGAARAHHNPLMSRGGVGTELRGFDAAPYRTTVHFRDR